MAMEDIDPTDGEDYHDFELDVLSIVHGLAFKMIVQVNWTGSLVGTG